MIGENLMNKTALVTGGSHNIGQQIAIVLARHGYDVAITYNSRKEGALDTQREIEALGRKCFVYQAKLQISDVPQKIVDQAHKDLGHLDLMVCNAANGGYRGGILTATPEKLDEAYNLNYRNYIICAAASARHMVADKIAGNIIFISSIRAQRAFPDDYMYGGFKAGIERAAQSMALELSQYGIRVNCVAPGCIWPQSLDVSRNQFITQSIPLKRVGTPEEVGELVAFVASDNASYITGISILQDGGLGLPGMWEREEPTVWLDPDWKEREYKEAMEMVAKSKENE